jgi:hypothetical protein
MKHPQHKTSKNEYVGRTNTKLGLKAKIEFKEELRKFNKRVKNLLK